MWFIPFEADKRVGYGRGGWRSPAKDHHSLLLSCGAKLIFEGNRPCFSVDFSWVTVTAKDGIALCESG